ncbi:MAG: 3-ketoacyl-ACP reductase [Oscillospiraceae bacterium]|jgi:NAD(P)-dependent dehydrogenase (short-subunit alcohol dehydrogenase family)|nr:3-ketoacyl-ACP reductase [Oscillospiraceae bacterium]
MVIKMKKVALITGSRQGIGLATAKTLAENGYFAVLSDVVEPDGAREALTAVSTVGECDYIKCDISSDADRDAVFREILARYGRLDVLVNNAGVAPQKRADVLETTEASFDRLMEINLKGTFFMCQRASGLMLTLKAADPGLRPRIVNISSVSAYTSSTSRGEYCISKAGISMVTKLFADRLAEEGIPVFEVRPGIILSDMTLPVKEKYQTLIEGGITPIKRFGTPEDVANCVLAACGGLLDFSAGQVLNADGGFELRRL